MANLIIVHAWDKIFTDGFKNEINSRSQIKFLHADAGLCILQNNIIMPNSQFIIFTCGYIDQLTAKSTKISRYTVYYVHLIWTTL